MRKVLWGICGFLLGLALAAGLFFRVDQTYRVQKTEFYQEKIQALRELQNREKQWIGENQGAEGAIDQYDSQSSRTVNPYFACQAAMGLLAGSPTRQELSQAGAYLQWHTRQILESDGIVSDYSDQGEGLLPTEDQDSVDAYLGLYLTLLSEYYQKAGTLNAVAGWQEALDIVSQRLLELLDGSLTAVSADNPVAYLMDNAEVWEGCHRTAAMLEATEGSRMLLERFRHLEESLWEGIRESLWNEEEGRFEIGLNGNGTPLVWERWEDFYPDSIVQVFPAACGLSFDAEAEKGLYDALCSRFAWEYREMETTFDWAVMAYIGAVMGDTGRAETYLKAYQAAYAEDRSYPLHTGEAGWIARTAQVLIDTYTRQAETGLLQDLGILPEPTK